jgi:hypothetical protein
VQVGDKVFVLPSRSLKFGGKWGLIDSINETAGMPFKVTFIVGMSAFHFDKNELLSEEGYLQFVKDNTYCTNVEGTKLRIKRCVSPSHVETDGGTFPVHRLLPITRCRSCNCDTTGLVSIFCEECEYHIPE